MNQIEIQQKLDELQGRVDALGAAVDYEGSLKRYKELEQVMSKKEFWDDAENARNVVEEVSAIKGVTEQIGTLQTDLQDVREFFELACEEDEKESFFEEIEKKYISLFTALEQAELGAMLSGPYDRESAFLNIYAGAGGTDACDWAEMLARMYLRWCEEQGYASTVIDRVEGDEAGIRHMTIHVKGACAYGYLKAEIGVHRLVRKSPFDSKNRRHTSFAAVDVSPEAGEDAALEIQKNDLKTETFRSSGAGGQHVNVTDSAVRITHLPTGIVVQCQNERSQHSNRAMAMKILKSRLLQRQEQEREEAVRQAYDDKGEIAWGSQIRSYVLHPYTMVKDHRTDVETGKVHAVLDGELNDFINEYLRSQSGRKKSSGS